MGRPTLRATRDMLMRRWRAHWHNLRPALGDAEPLIYLGVVIAVVVLVEQICEALR